jgi:hypothetical protein
MADANDRLGDAFAGCPCGATEHVLAVAESMPSAHPDPGGLSEVNPPSLQRPQALATVDPIATGVVLILVAKDPGQVDPLRAAAREFVRVLPAGCVHGGRQTSR